VGLKNGNAGSGYGGPVTITNGTITGGDGTAYGVGNTPGVSNYCGTVTLTNVNLVNGATSVAYEGKPPIWNISNNANYSQWKLNGTTDTKMVVCPAQGKVALDTVLYTGHNGTRKDADPAKVWWEEPHFGDPDWPLDPDFHASDISGCLPGVIALGQSIDDVDGSRIDCPPADARRKGSSYYGHPDDLKDGSAYIPTASQTLYGVNVDATTGNVTLPNTGTNKDTGDVTLVKDGALFGPNDASEGTYVGGGSALSRVRLGM
jgi:hypothetical protein